MVTLTSAIWWNGCDLKAWLEWVQVITRRVDREKGEWQPFEEVCIGNREMEPQLEEVVVLRDLEVFVYGFGVWGKGFSFVIIVFKISAITAYLFTGVTDQK